MVEASLTLSFRNLLLAAVVAVAAQVPITAIAWSRPAATCDAATGSHHVALVLQHEDGSTVTRCIAFSGASLTGEQVLAQSGVEYKTVVFGGLSDAVCQIDGEPATFPQSCWTSQSNFWAFFVARKGGSWFSSSLGIAAQTFHDGDAEGLRFEPQDVPLPPNSLGNCPPPVATPRPTPRPTATPIPTQPTTTERATQPPAGSTPPSQPPASIDDPAPSSAPPSPAATGAVIAIVATPG
ncbi:MAG: hypothetical protein ACRDGI_08460, partial [Candidatus Limnocylindrales bacterium]